MKQWWDITEEDQKAIMENTEWCMADNGYFRGGGYSSRYETRAQMPATMIPSEPCKKDLDRFCRSLKDGQ